jgi:hypothetical protein
LARVLLSVLLLTPLAACRSLDGAPEQLEPAMSRESQVRPDEQPRRPSVSSSSTRRKGDFENGFAGWDLGGPNVLPSPGASVVPDSELRYEGAASARARLPAGSGSKYARTIWGGTSGQKGALDLGEGEDFTYGMALYLPPGFYSRMQAYFVPMRWDNFGVTNVSRSGLAMYSDGRLRLVREQEGLEDQVNLLGTRTFRLQEGRWHWLEVRQKLSSRDGSALNEVRVDDRLIGRSTSKNYYGEPVSALRFGIVAVSDDAQSRALTIHYDRAILGSGFLGGVR